MNIRDDRKSHRGMPGVLDLNRPGDAEKYPARYAPEFVLYDCPDCHRSHFVTVDACPDAATAAKETAMVDRRAA